MSREEPGIGRSEAWFGQLTKPRGIALVGVSSAEAAFAIGGRAVLRHLQMHGFPGQIYPVHPTVSEIHGLLAYPTVDALPEVPDCVVVAVPAMSVVGVLEASDRLGVPTAVVISGGFADGGTAGSRAQDDLLRFTQRSTMRICGPNTTGIITPSASVAMSAIARLESDMPLLGGPIALVTQSGGVGNLLLDRAQEVGIGFSHILSGGNEVDLQAADYIAQSALDPAVRVIACHVEGIRDPKRFIRAAEACRRAAKPLLVYKVGRSEDGRRAASSHTGALAGDSRVLDAVFTDLGVVVVKEVSDLFATADVLAYSRFLPQAVGPTRIGVFSISGGIGTMTADEIGADPRLTLPALADTTKAKLARIYGGSLEASNPFDPAGLVLVGDRFEATLRALVQDTGLESIVVALPPLPGYWENVVADAIVKVSREVAKSFFVLWCAALATTETGRVVLRSASIPVFATVSDFMRAIGHAATHRALNSPADRGTNDVTEVIDDPAALRVQVNRWRDWLRRRSSRIVNEHEAKDLLADFGLPVTRESLANSPEQAVTAAEAIGWPVVMKVHSNELIHKSDIGGVHVGLQDPPSVERAFGEISEVVREAAPDATIDGVLLQEMVVDGTELLLGVVRDEQWGPMVLLGAGGIYAEVFDDTVIRPAPVDRVAAQEMIDGLRIAPLLRGARGQRPRDVVALARLICQVSELAVQFEDQIWQLDLNPIIVLPDDGGVRIVDAVIVLPDRRASATSPT